MSKYYPPLEPNSVYHIFTHAVHDNNLFYNKNNYLFFLKRWDELSKPFLTTYGYCLMPNHLHLCIQTAPETEIPLENRNNSFLSKQVGNVLSSYAQALNLQRGREGALYRSRFGRIKVDNRTYLKNLICYLNFNPLHHFDYEGCETYSYSSFPRYLQYASLSPKEAMREIITPTAYQTILTVFGGFENFLKYHEDYKQRKDQQLIETRMKSYDKQIVFSTNGDLAQLIL